METEVCEDVTIINKTPTKAFSWLIKAPTGINQLKVDVNMERQHKSQPNLSNIHLA